MKTKYFQIILLLFAVLAAYPSVSYAAKSVRAERRAVNAGNKLVMDGKLADAIRQYEAAIKANPESEVARFNLGLTQINLSKSVQNNDSLSQKLLSVGAQYMEQISRLGRENPSLASKASYNLGNLAFEKEDYAGAISMYKQALRLDPKFDNARRNLRIAQLKQQNQDKNQNKDNKDNKENQDKKDQQDKQDHQQNQNQDQQDQKQQPPQQYKSNINPQTAEQILKAVENNETHTRLQQGNPLGEQSSGARSSLKNW